MNGISNANPIQDTFLIGSRFPQTKSIAVLLDSCRSQEYYELSQSIFSKEAHQYDIAIFSSDNNSPILMPPCGLYYYNYLENYSGNVLAVTVRGAVNAMDCGAIFDKKVWHISDISDFSQLGVTLDKLFDFFDNIVFVNNFVKKSFFSIHENTSDAKTSISEMDIISLETYFL